MRTFTSLAKFGLILLAAILAMVLVTSNAEAKSNWLDKFYERYDFAAGTRLDTCGLCHVNFKNGSLNDYGLAFQKAGGTSDPIGAFIALEGEDPDKDTASSLKEIKQFFLPGWNCTTIQLASNTPRSVEDYVDPTNPGCWSVTGPAIAATPLSMDFGTVDVGKNPPPLTTRISNEGDSDLTISNLSITGSQYFVLNGGATFFILAPGDYVDVFVDYTPGETGDHVGTLEISSDDSDTPSLAVNLAGSALSAPQDLVSDLDIAGFRATKRLSLGRQKPANIKLVLVNRSEISGSGTVTLAGYGVNGELLFKAPQPDITLAVGERVTLKFDHTPDVTGTYTWTATLEDDNPDVDEATATTKVVP